MLAWRTLYKRLWASSPNKNCDTRHVIFQLLIVSAVYAPSVARS